MFQCQTGRLSQFIGNPMSFSESSLSPCDNSPFKCALKSFCGLNMSLRYLMHDSKANNLFCLMVLAVFLSINGNTVFSPCSQKLEDLPGCAGLTGSVGGHIGCKSTTFWFTTNNLSTFCSNFIDFFWKQALISPQSSHIDTPSRRQTAANTKTWHNPS